MALSPSEWFERIKKGIDYRRQFAGEDNWARWWGYYRNDYGDNGLMPVNLIFAMGRSLIPRLYFRNPRVVVTPLQPGRYLHAKVLERVDNLVIREIRVKEALKAAALDAYLYGTGIVKRGFDSEFGFSPKRGQNVGGVHETPTGEKESGERIEYDSTIRAGWPWVKRIHPSTFVVPWGTRELDSAPWCAHMVIRPLEDVKADPKYSKSAVKDLKGTLTGMPALGARPSVYDVSAQNGEYVKLWEIYDAKTGKIYVIAEGHDKFLREEEDVLSNLGFPFYPVVFNPDNDHFWGISDCVNLEPLQLELNETVSHERAQRRIALAKFLYKRGTITEDSLLKLLSGDLESIGIGIPVETSGPLSDAVHVLQPHVPPDLVMHANQIRMWMREVAGFSRNELGEYDTSTRRTATEATIVHQAAAIRVDERRDVLADVLADIVRGINDSIFDWWTVEQVANIVGPDGARYWVRYTGPDLRGDYTYRIDPDNALPTTSETRRQEAIELWKALANDVTATPQGPVPTFNKQELARHLLMQFEGIDIDAVMNPQMVGPQTMGAMHVDQLAQQFAQALMAGMARA